MMKKVKFQHLLYVLLLVILTSLIVDFTRISKYDTIPARPSEGISIKNNQLRYDLANDADEIDWIQLDGALEWIRNEYDCSDFRLINLVRILYEAGNRIPESYREEIEQVLSNFRWWWGDPGENSMCYWTENHQILFASAEYLVGQIYPNTVFSNSGLTGKQHMARAKQRALDWLEMRWNYGFSEFYSSYYHEDVAALLNIIDFADDEELLIKSRMILDLLFYDIATQNINGMFVSTSARAHAEGRKGGPGSTLGGITRYFRGDGKALNEGKVYGMMTTKNYNLPPVLIEIAKDSSEVIMVQPDICGICDPKKLDEQGCLGAPDLIVEILSPGNSKTELKHKFQLYEANGVLEHWIIHAETQDLLIYSLANGKYVPSLLFTSGDVVESKVIEGFELGLEEFFGDIV